MVLGSGSHSRSQVSVANPWVDRIGDFQVPPPVYPRQSNPRRSKPERCTRAYYGLDTYFILHTSYFIYFNRVAEKQINTYRACVPDIS